MLSSGVALTGIAVPIGLSYTLQGLLNATPVQAFAAGAALCSTSLGTTFTVLGSSGLSASRLGVVLTSAAMMDDVVGLVMVQVISNLGGDNFTWVTVVRPVLVSVAFAVVVPVICLVVVKPLTLVINRHRQKRTTAGLNQVLRKRQTVFVVHTLVLLALVTGATYAGTSNLFAAYIAGAGISWWDTEVDHDIEVSETSSTPVKAGQPSTDPISDSSGITLTLPPHQIERNAAASDGRDAQVRAKMSQAQLDDEQKTCGSAIYHHYYNPAVSKFLQPLFFASIGFSIPITRMFDGAIVWRGIVFTVLMAFAKLVCGLWLVRFTFGSGKNNASRVLSKLRLPSAPHFWGRRKRTTVPPQAGVTGSSERPQPTGATTNTNAEQELRRSSPNPTKPLSLHPPLILALAMCARGEIGFLISGVAESNGIFSATGEASAEPSDIFLVVTWAIVLCTIVGPLGVGLSVRRVKKLQERKNKQHQGSGRDVLGVWGVE